MQDELVLRYKDKHKKSASLHARAEKLLADGTTHLARVLEPFSPYIKSAKGSHKYDEDGNDYIDYVLCHGALIMGHSHPDIVKAVQEQVARGVHYGANHELEVEWAELIHSMMPSAEKVRFLACGNEAMMMGLRLGRIITGRKKVLKFEEAYHGWFDHITKPGTPGVLAEDNSIYTTVIPYDLNRLEAELAKKEYAVLMNEGGGSFMGGRYPIDDGFVRAIPELTKKYGTVWLMDEVVTGFRYGVGGWQGKVGVKPDLTALGKCVGGGLSCGALVGRADIMGLFSVKTPLARRVGHAGTWNANPLAAAAGVAALKILKTGEHQRKADEAAARLRKQANELLRQLGVKGRFYGHSVCHAYLGPIEFEPADDTLPPTKDIHKLITPPLAPPWNRFLLHMLSRGVDALAGEMFITSSAHSAADIDYTVKMIGESLEAMKAEGTLGKEYL